MRTWIARTILFSQLILICYTGLVYAQELTLYSSQESAQRRCPEDEVVWLNTSTGIWHIKGARWYGNTKQGAYVCKKEAVVAGNRSSLNG